MKLVPAAEFNQPVPYLIRLPYPAIRVKACVTVIVLDNNQVECYGDVADESVGTGILQAGLERLAQYHAQQKSAILGLDGQPLPSPNTSEGEA